MLPFCSPPRAYRRIHGLSPSGQPPQHVLHRRPVARLDSPPLHLAKEAAARGYSCGTGAPCARPGSRRAFDLSSRYPQKQSRLCSSVVPGHSVPASIIIMPPATQLDPADPTAFTHRSASLKNGHVYHYIDESPALAAGADVRGTCLLLHGFPDLWQVDLGNVCPGLLWQPYPYV